LQEFTDWVRAGSPLQGWVADCAWLPEFDTYEDYQMTPYEIVGIGEAGTGRAARIAHRHVAAAPSEVCRAETLVGRSAYGRGEN